MSGSGLEALPDVREWSGGPPECPAVDEMPFQMSGSGREALHHVCEALLDVRKWSGGPPGFYAIGPDAIPVVRVWSGGHPDVQERSESHLRGSGGVGRLSQLSRIG